MERSVLKILSLDRRYRSVTSQSDEDHEKSSFLDKYIFFSVQSMRYQNGGHDTYEKMMLYERSNPIVTLRKNLRNSYENSYENDVSETGLEVYELRTKIFTNS